MKALIAVALGCFCGILMMLLVVGVHTVFSYLEKNPKPPLNLIQTSEVVKELPSAGSLKVGTCVGRIDPNAEAWEKPIGTTKRIIQIGKHSYRTEFLDGGESILAIEFSETSKYRIVACK